MVEINKNTLFFTKIFFFAKTKIFVFKKKVNY